MDLSGISSLDGNDYCLAFLVNSNGVNNKSAARKIPVQTISDFKHVDYKVSEVKRRWIDVNIESYTFFHMM